MIVSFLRSGLVFPLSTLLVSLAFTNVHAAEPVAPLHEQIDAAIEAELDFPPAPLADDAEFLRRVYLDLAGSIPPVEVAREFLADTASDKRQRLIDRLLASPYFVRRMQTVFDVMLMQRRPDKYIKSAEWRQFLWDSFAENKPYDQLVREILAADGVDPQMRSAARFYLDREAEINVLTRDVGRLFLGRDMQCAQCHDHPLVGGYLQDHYYGIYAFLNRSFLFTDAKQKKSFLAEKAEGVTTFKSVFNPDRGTVETGPRLIEAAVVKDPTFAKGEEYYVKPAKNVRPVPKYSRREQLAREIASGECDEFNRNIANRLWAQMMGRGLVDPVDWHHEDNPPSHPELLDLLTRQFVDMKFNIRALVRELALTKTYQRTSQLPEDMTDEQSAPERFAVAPLKPLEPEQFAWSLMEAAGMALPLRKAEAARVDTDSRLADIFTADPQRETLRETYLEQAVYGKLAGNVNQFISLFGGSPGEPENDFQATVHQALFFSNAATIRSWLNVGPHGLVPRLAAMEDMGQVANELYLNTLSRHPSEEERLAVAEYVIRRDNRRTALEEMAWALLASSEFRFNH